MIIRIALLAAALALGSGNGLAQMGHDHRQHSAGSQSRDGECKEVGLACATKVTPAFAPDGALWLAYAAAGQVLVTRSPDLGRTFQPPVAVTLEAMQLDWGPDARPKIAIDGQGHIHVAFAIFQDKHFNGQVLVSRSTDGGASFSAPQPITDVQESQRFEALAIDADGQVFAAWLDKRPRIEARARGQKYPGAALAFAWIGHGPPGGTQDGKAAIGETRLAKDETCECCRLAVGFAGPGRPVVMFRNIFDKTTRDHAIIAFADRDTPGPVRRVSVDDWRTDACPHHGPGLSVSADGAYHVVWFTGGSARKGLFYARSNDAGASFTDPMPFGQSGRQPEHPSVLALADRVWIVWKEFDGTESAVVAISSPDRGMTWSAPRVLATTSDSSDHPLLIAKADHSYLSWQTSTDGYRLIELESTSASAPSTPVIVRPFVRGSWQDIRAVHAGKPIAVHFWGATCAPCRVEMPIWGDLVKQRPDLALVTIHAERSPPDPRIVPGMLTASSLAATENWAFADRFQQALRFEINPEWQGELPMTLLVGRDGNIKTIIGSAEPQDVQTWLDAQKANAPTPGGAR